MSSSESIWGNVIKNLFRPKLFNFVIKNSAHVLRCRTFAGSSCQITIFHAMQRVWQQRDITPILETALKICDFVYWCFMARQHDGFPSLSCFLFLGCSPAWTFLPVRCVRGHVVLLSLSVCFCYLALFLFLVGTCRPPLCFRSCLLFSHFLSLDPIVTLPCPFAFPRPSPASYFCLTMSLFTSIFSFFFHVFVAFCFWNVVCRLIGVLACWCFFLLCVCVCAQCPGDVKNKMFLLFSLYCGWLY